MEIKFIFVLNNSYGCIIYYKILLEFFIKVVVEWNMKWNGELFVLVINNVWNIINVGKLIGLYFYVGCLVYVINFVI